MGGDFEWLPAIVAVDGVWEGVPSRLYQIFELDFKMTRRYFDSLPVWWDRTYLPGECYEEGFWHLITKNIHRTGERLFEPRRAERLPWCGPTVSNSHHQVVKVFDYREGRKRRLRTYIWLEPLDYAIILERKQMRLGRVAFLITAFYIDGESGRRRLQRKFENRDP